MWTCGNDVEVFWKIIEGNDDKKVRTIDLDLMQGRSKRPDLIDNIAFGVEWNHGDAFWTVNKKLPSGDDYFIRITSADDKDFFYEGPFFTIKSAGEVKAKNDQQVSSALPSASPSLYAFLISGCAALFACL